MEDIQETLRLLQNLQLNQTTSNKQKSKQNYRQFFTHSFYIRCSHLEQIYIRATSSYYTVQNNLHIYWKIFHEEVWKRAYRRLRLCISQFFDGVEQLTDFYQRQCKKVPKSVQNQYEEQGFQNMIHNIQMIHKEQMERHTERLGGKICKSQIDKHMQFCAETPDQLKRNRPSYEQSEEGTPRKKRNTGQQTYSMSEQEQDQDQDESQSSSTEQNLSQIDEE